MPPTHVEGQIYSATYSNVPVYEFNVDNNHVMRRRSDDYINATHILKVADFDKPARTRILEREVQRGTHEKVQGGYGKYQGTWIPLEDARALAEKNGVIDKLGPIFDYVPGDRSPPPAPKHATASSNKTKQQKQTAASRVSNAAMHQRNQRSDMSFDNYSVRDEGTPDNQTLASEPESEFMHGSRQSAGGSRKRKRGQQVDRAPSLSYEEQQHMIWSDELLDYFMLQTSKEPPPHPPEPPSFVDLNRAIDDKGHTAIHWAAAMGDVNVVKDLKRRGAHINVQSNTMGETPLMRAVMFTNNFENQTMEEILPLLLESVGLKDAQAGTVFHHICKSTSSKSKYSCARYYLETILHTLQSRYQYVDIKALLDQQDHAGDTAILIAARHGARKCVRALIDCGATTDIPNNNNESADELIKDLNARRRDRNRPGSSSPVMGPNGHTRSSSLMNSAINSKPRYSSEAASLLASQLPTLIATRAEALATALESELAEREMEVHEAERQLEQRKAEIESLARQSNVLAAKSEDDAYDAAQLRELEALIAESRSLLAAEQAVELSGIIKDELGRHPPSRNDSAEAETAEKLRLALQLANAQNTRRKLVEDVVQAQALAGWGTGQRAEMYKRLITGALGVRGDDVENLLPDILAELEDDLGVSRGVERDRDGDVSMRVTDTVRVA